jgi:hypothetical protein
MRIRATILALMLLCLAHAAVFAMAVTPQQETNAAPAFVENYIVGLLAFENISSATNLDYLSISLPLVLKEELKVMVDLFVTREDILLEGEEINWARAWQNVQPYAADAYVPSRTLRGEVVTRVSDEEIIRLQKMESSLRKRLLFSSELAARNDQTMDEIAQKQKWHAILFGSFEVLPDGKIRLRVGLYNAVRGIVIGNFTEDFPEERLFLDIRGFTTRIRSSLTAVPTATLRIESEPDHALVYINRQFVGYTPAVIEALAATNHEIQLRKDGYGQRTFAIDLKPGETHFFKESLGALSDFGHFAVDSFPSGATVLLDLLNMGTTPITLTNLRAGLYRVTLELDGYHTRHQQIEVKSGVTNSRRVVLDRSIPGELTIDEKSDLMRRWMNITFWSGGVMLVGYAVTYWSYQEKFNQAVHYFNRGEEALYYEAWNSSVSWRRGATAFQWATLGCFGASLYFLIRHLVYENKELGRGPTLLPDAITALPNQQVMMHWRF